MRLPHEDINCAFWDWRYQKCTALAKESADPKGNCSDREWVNIKGECEAALGTHGIEEMLLWYFQEYRENKEKYALGFKVSMNQMIDQIMQEMEEDEDED